ncbi:glycosyltransferase family 2 protein [Streptomyces oryzae]|uniref:Glycosyltransferase family 2 protein n=1 Tax=Streptomyces oryzae TaxID=1434886 RepID=A0ABS3XJF8_9ACTN|nr:glycosyltransferase family A protein [Streptomyces oryzae]MBO8195542.1 glycosyltransferase family 2 protein [Streptomyces oryzae]
MYGDGPIRNRMPRADRVDVDVVTAVHAAYARFLPNLWKSLREQTHPSWTWWVEVDGDADEVTEALTGCGAALDPRVRVNAHGGAALGPATVRNLALHRGAARCVQTADADDELEPEALSLLVTALAEHPGTGFSVGRARDLLPDGQLLEVPVPLAPGLLERGALAAHWVTTEDTYRLPVPPACAMYLRDLVTVLGGWQAAEGMEDTALLMAASAATPGVLLPDPTLRYRRHADQRSKQSRTHFVEGPQVRGVRSRVAGLLALPPWSRAAV